MAYYIWHDEGCCDNREERLYEARRVQTALMADGHRDVYITDEYHNVVGSKEVEMQCADEGLRLRVFAPCGDGDYICRHCGWMQISTAAGAAELCRSANWHDVAEYERYAAIAREGGFDVPLKAPAFRDEHTLKAPDNGSNEQSYWRRFPHSPI